MIYRCTCPSTGQERRYGSTSKQQYAGGITHQRHALVEFRRWMLERGHWQRPMRVRIELYDRTRRVTPLDWWDYDAEGECL